MSSPSRPSVSASTTDEPPRKVCRLTLITITDPSTPPNDGTSPFLNLPPELTDKVFCQLTECIREKMRLELVCERFRTRLSQKSSWLNTDELVLIFQGVRPNGLIGNGENCRCLLLINSCIHALSCHSMFDANSAPKALNSFLKRITVKRLIKLSGWVDEQGQQPLTSQLCNAIRQNKDSFQLERIQFGKKIDDPIGGLANPCTPETIWILPTLAAIGLDYVKTVQIGTLHSLNNICRPEFLSALWPFLSCCMNLVSLDLNYWKLVPVGMDDFDQVTDEQMLTNLRYALVNIPNLKQLRVGNSGWTAESSNDAIALLNNLSHMKTLKIHPEEGITGVMDLVNGLSDNFRDGISHLGMTLQPNFDNNPEFVRSILDYFPKLTNICFPKYEFGSRVVAEVCSRLADSLKSRGLHCGKIHMKVRSENRWEVISTLTGDRFTKFDRVIVEETDTVKCYKSDVVVQLNMSRLAHPV